MASGINCTTSTTKRFASSIVGGANNGRAIKAPRSIKNSSRETNLRFPQDIGQSVGPIGGINIAGYVNLAALQAAFAGAAPPRTTTRCFDTPSTWWRSSGHIRGHYYLHDYLDLVIDANLAHGTNGPIRGAGPDQNYTIAVSDLINNFDPAYFNNLPD